MVSWMSDSMSRSSDRLRSPGEGPRQARPTTPGDPDAEVPAAQALPRRPGAAPSRAPDRPVGPRGRRGAHGLPASRQRAARGERRVRRCAGTHAGAHLGALRRPGRRPGHHRRPAPRDQRPGRRLVDDRRRFARACSRGRGLRLLRARPARRAAVRVDRRPGGHVGASSDDGRGVIDEPTRRLDEGALRALVPRVLAGLVRRGEDFDAAEDALQEALLEALRVWPEHPPRDPRAWLQAVAVRRLVDARRSAAARARREETTVALPPSGAPEEGDDTLFLLFCCCSPELAPTSQVALTLRAVGGLTTREIADAFYVPEATMAQRISRAKRTLQGRRLDQPGDLAVVLRVLYLIYTAGHGGRVDLAGEAIRLARQLTLATEEPEARGLLALMLLNHARLPARFDAEGRIVTLDRQDRSLWDSRQIAEGVRVLQSALVMQTEQRRPGRYQVEAAIAALHDDAASAEETDWPQILDWYDDLVALTEDPVRQDPAAVLGRAVAVGHVLGGAAGLRETDRLREVIGERHRWHAVRGHLHELDGDLAAAAAAYAEAARRATNVAERDHLVHQAARARAADAT